MEKKEKDLLLKELCARLPYFPLIQALDDYGKQCVCKIAAFDLETKELSLTYSPYFKEWDYYSIEEIKPYLRPMSSMTQEELKIEREIQQDCLFGRKPIMMLTDFYYSRHLDVNGLIECHLAVEAPEGMYSYEY